MQHKIWFYTHFIENQYIAITDSLRLSSDIYWSGFHERFLGLIQQHSMSTYKLY